MKRLSCFLDGTWNDVDDETNVCRLHRMVAATDGGLEQRSFYQAGVGNGRFDRLRGGAFGHGLGQHVVEAYEWLREHYDDGDEIYLFGFSRGAFTARSVAGMIAKCGLLHRGSEINPRQLFERYQRSRELPTIYEVKYAKETGKPITADEAQLLAESRRVKIRMIGVWDTVGALGIPFGNVPGLSRRSYRFHHTRLSNIYEHAFQALALDENRGAYEPTLWTRFDPLKPDPTPTPRATLAQVEQRWFAGAHADVGGGTRSNLHEVSLEWMALKAQHCGLTLRRSPTITAGAELAPVSDSYSEFMWGIYKVATLGKRFHRGIDADPVRKPTGIVTTVNETIDGRVFLRWRKLAAYRPPSLVRWASRHGIDPAQIDRACRASDGSPI